MIPFWSHHPVLAAELETVLHIINSVNRTSEAHFNESVDYLTATGGKMLRPAFFLIGTRFGPVPDDGKRESLLTLAAAIENLHLATLIHDDIIDESRLRRGTETIQSRYGKEYAVYMGDYLLCQCFLMLSDHAYDRETLKVLAEGVSRVCLGEIRQYRNRHNMTLSLREYRKIIAGKTAALFAVSLFAGARESGAEESVTKTLARIGFCVGMAFQIVDDLLDFQGDTERLGKEILMDLQKGCYTLPLLLGLQGAKAIEINRLMLRGIATAQEAFELKRLLQVSGALAASEEVAGDYLRKAMKYSERLPEGSGKEILRDVLPVLLKRQA